MSDTLNKEYFNEKLNTHFFNERIEKLRKNVKFYEDAPIDADLFIDWITMRAGEDLMFLAEISYNEMYRDNSDGKYIFLMYVVSEIVQKLINNRRNEC